MNRLLATLLCDVRLQLRNGFYYAVAFVLATWAIIVVNLPRVDWAYLLPALVLGNLMVATFMFMAGLVLLEKGEGTLEAQVVTPLSISEYLASKLFTLTALSIVENLVLVLLAHGASFRWLPMIAGICLASLIYCLTGFIAVSRYDSVNEFLFPSVLYNLFFGVPILAYFGLWENAVLYLHPLQAPLVLMKAGFYDLALWEWLYGVLYSMLWTAILFEWSRRRFHRFIIAREGAH